MDEQPRFTFRISLWRPWLLAVTPLAVIAALGVVVCIVVGKLGAAASILLAFAGLALVLLVPIGLVVQASRWHVDPKGIGGRNNWFVYQRLDWSEIESVEPWLIPGYQYVQLNGADKRWAFWLPLFLTDMSGLRSVVARYAPPGNPLRHYLEQHPA